ncbi:TPA: YhgE/Pip domain-containing protein [Clostridium botulinum]|uniref:YhgE/Pip domain-containing protein n=1 Tax=Clostridium TaxID=1485 RepID=UPI00077451B3|nr:MULTISPECIES: YhgE/Pip domain-containing protein [Clostridium]AUM94859.1 phage infection protein [Clostridium sporogenes]AVQ52296.1 YhgE/Pip domain-containing protein [Clostridium botulinum]HBJ2614926.1 YhgE/Pip domain-containing protein [Clostridium botulinum]
MKKAFRIFLRDLRNIVKHPAALIIVIGLSFIPSLYAWINIKACWDPYANTGNLPIAVVNKDEGMMVKGKYTNVGDGIVKNLKTNKKIGWVFVDEWQGNYGLNEGKYYALIEIPSNFTRGLTSLTTTDPQKPNIIYRVNEKANAIATKITNAAKGSLAKEIQTNFVYTVNKEALKVLNDTGMKLEKNKPQILEVRSNLELANKSIGEVKNIIGDASKDSESLQKYLNDTKNKLPLITDQINNLQKATESSKKLVSETEQNLNNISKNINNDIMDIESINNKIEDILAKLKELNNSGSNGEMIKLIDEASKLCDSINTNIDATIKSLETVNSLEPNESINNLINTLKSLKGKINTEKNKLDELKSKISNGNSDKKNIDEIIDSIMPLSNDINKSIKNMSNVFYNGITTEISNTAKGLNNGLSTANDILDTTKLIVPQLKALANFGVGTSKAALEDGKKINNKLSEFEKTINKLQEKTSSLTEDTLDKIINLSEKNPEKIASFISSPINIKEEEIYNTGIFGIGLTPFYTVLAIWVGVLLMSSLLSVEVEEFEGEKKLTHLQVYFGKLFLFLSIAIIQGLIVTLGDVFILGIKPASMGLLIVFTIVTAITFTFIIYTLVSIFGNLGKAIAVVIMVFQIAGAGGIYPIQTNPKIFGVLQPLWPFTYAIAGFREAIAGPVRAAVISNLRALFIFSIGSLLLVVLKKPLHKVTEYMNDKFIETGL